MKDEGWIWSGFMKKEDGASHRKLSEGGKSEAVSRP